LWLLPLAVAWRAYQLAAYGSAVLAVARTMLEQASGRDVGTSRHHLGALGNLAYYAQAVLTGAYPLSLLHPIALVDLLVRPRDARAASRWRLLALYPTATLAFFALVSKHFPWYVMPVYPFLCVFTGAWLDRLLQSGAPRGVWVALACAVAVAAWLRPPGLGYDPFQVSGRALLPVGWAHWGALGPALGVPATAALLAVILALVRARRPRAERVLAGALAACLLGVGLVRVLAPLRFVHYVSPMARLREQVDEARARGESIPYPLVYVKPQREEPDLMKLRYYFSDDFYIVKPPGGSRSAIVYLYERSRGRPPGRVS
jgi:4-amino-4-deoxy-L-arabinose transferase-like glycosyltransferase